MSEVKKSRFSAWMPTLILGVVTILFSFYAVQSQADLVEAREEIDRLESQLSTCAKESERQQQEAAETLTQMSAACEESRKQVEENCKKSNQRK